MDKISKINSTEKHKKKKYSWQYIEKAVNDLYLKIDKDKYVGIYGIPRGGLILAVMLSHKLNLPILTHENFMNSKILIVDDVSDSGNTIREHAKLYKNDVVTIHCKSCSTLKPTYYYEDIDENEWIVYPWE